MKDLKLFSKIPLFNYYNFRSTKLNIPDCFKNSFLQSRSLATSTNYIGQLDERQKHILGKGLPQKIRIPGVKHTFLVCSGKGGVGKSTIAVNLAVSLAALKLKLKVGLLDADVHGPSIPTMMNLHDQPLISKENRFLPLENYGVKCMSIGFLVDESAALIWRGLMVMSALTKMTKQVDWGDIDCLVIDTPPGTGDALLSIIQSIPITGALLVTTPQGTAVQVTRRGATMLQKLGVNIIGIVQNMSYVACPKCDYKFSIYTNTVASLSNELGVPILSQIPLNSKIAKYGEEGVPALYKNTNGELARTYIHLAQRVMEFVKKSEETGSQRSSNA